MDVHSTVFQMGCNPLFQIIQQKPNDRLFILQNDGVFLFFARKRYGID